MRYWCYLVVILVSGCATKGGSYCAEVDGNKCKEWVFGPSKQKQKTFDRRVFRNA